MKRTALQREADQLDLEIFRLAEKLRRFAKDFGQYDVEDLGIEIEQRRWTVRKHMHPTDRAEK